MPRNCIHLPSGFRFQPTDKELVLDYLLPKLRGCYLAADFIKFSPDVYEVPPSKLCTNSTALFGDDNIAKHYFFTELKRYKGRVSRTVGSCGSWHESIKNEINNNNKIIGFKRLLNFKLKGEGDCKSKKTTEWIMHEFSLNEGERNDFVLCVIQNKKKDEEKGSRSRLVLGLDLGSDSGSGLGRQLKIASVEPYVGGLDHHLAADTFPQFDPQFDCEPFSVCSEIIQQPLPRQDDPIYSPAATYGTTTANENPCPAQDEETQQSKKMRSGPGDLFSGCSGLSPREDDPIYSPAATSLIYEHPHLLVP